MWIKDMLLSFFEICVYNLHFMELKVQLHFIFQSSNTQIS